MQRSRILAALLLFALIVPLAGATDLGPPHGLSAAAQEMPDLDDAPVLTEDTVLLQDTGQFRSAAGALTVNISDREATRAFFNQYYLNAPTPDIGWTGNVGACQAGTTSQAFKDAVSLRINFFRAMAGVWAGTGLSSSANTKDQQAALMISANGALSHNPPQSWKCYTADGATAAGSSNIFLGQYGWDAIDGYMWDYGGNNAAAGHRANLLYPQTQLFGTGDIPGPFSQRWPANALWVFDSHVWDPRPATRDDFVAWPPKGYVPYQIVYPRWSFNYPGAGFTNATVTMKLNGTSVPVTVDYRSAALGAGYTSVPENTIVWRPNNLDSAATWPKPTNGDQTYTVTISNVTFNGQARTFTYSVTVFDPATSGSSANATASLSPTRGIPRSSVTASVSGFGKNISVPVKWGDTLLTTITTNSSGAGGGSFRVPYAPMGSYPVTFGAGGGSLTKSFEVVPRIALGPSSGAPGDTVNVSLRGYKARETVRIRWKHGSSWDEIARVTTSGTGSANIDVKVPSWAPAGTNSVRGDSTVSSGGRAQTNAFTVVTSARIQAGTMSLSADRGAVNSSLTATLNGFPANTAVTLTFPGYYEATTTGTTDASGNATLTLRVPATPLGAYTLTAKGGDTQVTGSYEVVPRIKLTPGEGTRGSAVSVSLRGYEPRETVRLRWQQGASWIELTRVTTSSSGSANVEITVPSWAPDGSASVRGDALSSDGGRAQTNAFIVNGGQFTDADAATPTPTLEPTTSTSTGINTVWAPFVDDFESGTLDQWTDVNGASVQAGDARDGVYAAVITSDGATPASARATLSVPQSELYVHTTFKPIAQGDNPVRLLQLRSVTDTPVVEVSLDAESHLVITNILTGRQDTGPVVTAGEWHELQLHVRIGNETGGIEVWFDGQRIEDLSTPDTLGSDPLAFLLIGDDTPGRSFDLRVDSIGVDLQCIGACPANAEPTPTVTPEPSITTEPTVEPTEEVVAPTPEPTSTPEPAAAEPTATPTEEPTEPPADEPTEETEPSEEAANQG